MEEMNEIHEFMSKFREGVEVIWGVAVDNSLDTKVKITVLATGFGVEDVPGMDTLHEARSQEEEERQLQLEEEKEKNKERIRKAYGESAGIGKKSLRSRRHIYIFNTEDLDNRTCNQRSAKSRKQLNVISHQTIKGMRNLLEKYYNINFYCSYKLQFFKAFIFNPLKVFETTMLILASVFLFFTVYHFLVLYS